LGPKGGPSPLWALKTKRRREGASKVTKAASFGVFINAIGLYKVWGPLKTKRTLCLIGGF